MAFFKSNSTNPGTKPCINCGAEIDADSMFCTTCGSRQDAAPVPPAAGGLVCSVCGAPLEPDSAFCTECGTPAGTASAAPVTPEPVYPPVDDVVPEGMIRCPDCGSIIDGDSSFCWECGHKFPVPTILSRCPNPECNSILPDDAEVCPMCGMRLMMPEPPNGPGLAGVAPPTYDPPVVTPPVPDEKTVIPHHDPEPAVPGDVIINVKSVSEGSSTITDEAVKTAEKNFHTPPAL